MASYSIYSYIYILIQPRNRVRHDDKIRGLPLEAEKLARGTYIISSSWLNLLFCRISTVITQKYAPQLCKAHWGSKMKIGDWESSKPLARPWWFWLCVWELVLRQIIRRSKLGSENESGLMGNCKCLEVGGFGSYPGNDFPKQLVHVGLEISFHNLEVSPL